METARLMADLNVVRARVSRDVAKRELAIAQLSTTSKDDQ